MTHTRSETNPWWEVDLQSNYSINQIKVYGRTDCCNYRLNGFILQIIRNGANVWKYQHTGIFYDMTVIEIPSIEGDRVKISLEGSNKILSLAEVQVFSELPIKDISLDPTIELGRCEGDCDSDNDCKSGLKCFHRDGDEAGPPECSGSMISKYDYCYLPHYPTRQPTIYPTRQPTENPTIKPTKYPTKQPTKYPTVKPPPTPIPTIKPFSSRDELKATINEYCQDPNRWISNSKYSDYG